MSENIIKYAFLLLPPHRGYESHINPKTGFKIHTKLIRELNRDSSVGFRCRMSLKK